MKMQIPRDTLLGPLSKVVGLTGTRSTMPILTNVLIDLGSENRVTATDIDTTIIAKINHSVDTTRSILIPGQKLHDILKLMDPVELNMDLRENTVVLTQGTSEFTLALGDIEEYPAISMRDPLTGTFKMKSSDFLKAIDRVAFAVSHDETRYILTGAYIEAKEGVIAAVGTDGFRMAVDITPVEGAESFKGQIIPRKALSMLKNIINSEEVTINTYETKLGVITDTASLYTTKIEGSFPDYSAVMPGINGSSAVVDRGALLKGLRKVSTIASARTDLMHVTFSKDEILLKVESDIGVAKEPVSAEYGGEDETAAFNTKFLMDILSNVEEEKVSIHIPHAYGAYLIVPVGNDNYKNIVMPVKL